MTVTPTPESNYELIQSLQELVSSAAEPPSGAEFSYPVVDQAMSSSMWQWVTKGVGSGIIDTGDYPYMLENLSNANNTATLTTGTNGTANAILEGFYHQLSDPMTVSLPMPSSGSVAYHVCLTYDPREESNVNGPISVVVHNGTPPITFGRSHIVLWRVTRTANQLLTNATVERLRPRIAPTTYVWRRQDLPDIRYQLHGAMCFVRDEGIWYRASTSEDTNDGLAWVAAHGEFRTVGYGGTYGYPGHGHLKAIMREGNRRTLRGRWNRLNGASFAPSSSGFHLWTLDTQDRPGAEVRRIVAGSNLASPNFGVVNISASSGEVRFHPVSSSAWVDIGEIAYSVAGS